MPAFTYDPGLVVNDETGDRVLNAIGELRETPDGPAVAVYDLLGTPMANLTSNDDGVCQRFSADIPRGYISFGSTPQPVASDQMQDAMPAAERAAVAAEAARAAAEQAAADAAAALALMQGGGGGGSVDTLDGTGTVGRASMKAETAVQGRSAIGAGTSSLALGTTALTAKAGNWVPSMDDVTGLVERFAELDDSIATIRNLPNPNHLAYRWYNPVTGWGGRPDVTGMLWIGGTAPTPPPAQWGADVWLREDFAVSTYIASNTFDGWADQATITQGVAHSGTDWDVVQPAAGGSITAVSSPTMTGARAARYATGSTAGQSWTAWRAAVGVRTQATFGFAIYLTAYPSANCTVLRYRQNTGTEGAPVYGAPSGVRITPAGIVQFMDVGFTATAFSTAAPIPLNTVVKIEDARTWGPNAADGRMRGWVTPVGGATESLGDETTQRNTGVSPAEYSIGVLSTLANYAITIDDPRVGNAMVRVLA